MGDLQRVRSPSLNGQVTNRQTGGPGPDFGGLEVCFQSTNVPTFDVELKSPARSEKHFSHRPPL